MIYWSGTLKASSLFLERKCWDIQNAKVPDMALSAGKPISDKR